jgi:hypothetical protein
MAQVNPLLTFIGLHTSLGLINLVIDDTGLLKATFYVTKGISNANSTSLLQAASASIV